MPYVTEKNLTEAQSNINILVPFDIPDPSAFTPITNQRVNQFLPFSSKSGNRSGICEVPPIFRCVVL